MDHIPLPQNSFSKYPVIKCVCAVEDVRTGSTRIQRLSEFTFLKEQFTKGSHDIPSLAAATPFLQAWLWYGLLERIFDVVGVPFDPTEFAPRDESVGFRLSTVALHRYLWYWVAVESRASDAEKTLHVGLVNEYIDEVYDALQCYTIESTDADSPQIQDGGSFGPFLADGESNVLLAIVVLAEALDFAQETIYRDFRKGGGRAWDETLSVRSWLLQAGWCIKELSWLTNQFTVAHVTLLLYLSRIDRHVHGKDHGECRLELCTHEIIDYATYRPVHSSTGCYCAVITPRYDAMMRMDRCLCKRTIPLITYTAHDSLEPRIHVQEFSVAKTETSYVAISHVWSDRLGNLRENGLPACQLQRLQSYVNALYPTRRADVPFWIDTICVPREKTAKILAIQGMRDVYERADKVLVLDSSLLTVESSAVPEEILLRIKVAPWSTRLWTYHEGALARQIYFQLKDCAVVGDEIRKKYNSRSSEAAGTVRIQDLLQFEGNEENNRSLVRAMALDENEETFVDLQSEAEIPISLNVSATGSPDTDVGLNEDSIDSSSESSERILVEDSEQDESMNESMASDDLEAIRVATEASIASTQAIHAEILRLKAETARAKELTAQKKAEAQFWASASERLQKNSLGGFSHWQVRPAELYLNLPTTWMTEPPQSWDKKLANDVQTITGNRTPSRYWLRAFDPIYFEGSDAYYDLRTAFKRLHLNMYTNPVPTSGQIREIISAVRWRTTSWQSDEAVCFAILLDMDVGKVQRAHGQDRMKTLASMWHEVPSELLFCELKKLQSDGSRWMPQTFLGSGLGSGGPRLKGHETAHRIERGLCVETEGIMFDLPSQRPKCQSIAFKLEERWVEIWVNAAGEDRSWDDVDGGPLAVLYEDGIEDRVSQTSIKAIVARVVEESVDMIYVSLLLNVRLSLTNGLDGLVLVHEPKVSAKHQQWCVG